MPEITIAAIPIKYAEVATQAFPPKIAPAIIAINGTFALQGMNVVVMIVIRRSRSFSIVRLAIIPGTPQPTPTNIGINDFPDNPNLRKILSNTNAIRAIYPQPSKKASKKNNTNIWGTNPRTAPTPAIIPSRINPFNHSAQLRESKIPSVKSGILGTKIPYSAGSGASAPYCSHIFTAFS